MLLICTSCTRHIRPTESACPFCGGLERREGPRPASRATRAAMLFGSAAAVVAGVACSDTATPGDAGPVAVDAAYGGPPFDASFDAPFAIDAAYGGPPPFDSSFDAPIAVDAAYGGPPFDSGRD